MKRLQVYFEREEACEQLKKSLHNKDGRPVEVQFRHLKDTFWTGGQKRDELAKMGFSDWQEALYVTDIPKLAVMLASKGYPVLVHVHEGNREIPIPGVRYVIEGFEDVDAEYYLRIWQRLTGKPWHILDTERCSIRETVTADLDAFYEIYKEPSVTEYMEDLFPDRNEEKAYVETYAKTIYDFYGFGMWTVILKETGEIIGRAGIDVREGYEYPELGFLIGVSWQGKGLAKEVCSAILNYAKEELELQRIQAFVQPGNEKSVNLLRKLGFSCEGEEKLQGERHFLYAKELQK